MGNTEQRILELERRFMRLPVDRLEGRVAVAEERSRMRRNVSPPPLQYIDITVYGCLADGVSTYNGVPGATVTLVGRGSQTTDSSGNALFTYLGSAGPVAYSVNAGGRFNVFTGVAYPSSANVAHLTPASGYVCFNQDVVSPPRGWSCAYPIKTSLTLFDPNGDKGANFSSALTYVPPGSGTVNLGAFFGTTVSPADGPYWYVNTQYDYAKCVGAGCTTNENNVQTLYLFHDGVLTIYFEGTGGGCPKAGGGFVLAVPLWVLGSCPPAATTLTAYSMTYGGAFSMPYCGTSPGYGNITITEV